MAENVDDAGAVQAESGGHVLGRLQREAVDEGRQPAQQSALGVGQQVVAPVDGRSQRLVTRQLGAVTAAEHTKAVIQPRGDLFGRQCTDPRGGQLDRQRQPVEMAADVRHRLAVAGGEKKRR